MVIVYLFTHDILYNFLKHFSSVWDESTSKRDESTNITAAHFAIWLLHDGKNNVTGKTGGGMRLFFSFLYSCGYELFLSNSFPKYSIMALSESLLSWANFTSEISKSKHPQ